MRRITVSLSLAASAALASVFAACGEDAAPLAEPPLTRDASVAIDATTTSDAATTSMPDGSDATVVDPPRFEEVAGVLHVHSAYSHDGCDNKGLDNGVPNAQCIAELRASPCKAGLGFVFLTDHPAHMNEYEPIKNLLFDAAAGDQLVMDTDGTTPIANVMTCQGGRKVVLMYGFEGTHTLPLGLKRHPADYNSYSTTRSLGEVQATVDGLKDAGAIVGLAHSEEDDITSELIVQGGADVMEWYNPHGNFKTALGGDSIGGSALAALSFLSGLSPFLAGSTSGAHADLLYLKLLPSWPKAGFDKWREVQKVRHVPGVFGSDVHQNVSVDPVCSGAAQVLCAAAAGSNASALAMLISGGQLVLSDGRRLDAYERIMRWLQNRVLVNGVTRESVMDAVKRGRSYGIFSVFGDAQGFRFDGVASGKPIDMGDVAVGSAALRVKVPTVPVPIPGGAPFPAASASSAEVRTSLFRTDATGTVEVATANGLGATVSHLAAAPGSYHAEIWIKPKHLKPVLGPEGALADAEYLWLIANPIRVQ